MNIVSLHRVTACWGGGGTPALGIQSGLLFEAWSPTLDPERQSAPVRQLLLSLLSPTRGGWTEGSHGARSALLQREDPMGYGPDRTPSKALL